MTLRRLFILLLTICCAISLTAAPTKRKVKKKRPLPKHYIDVYAGGGVTGMGYSPDGGKMSPSGSFSVGAGYTWFFVPYMGLQTGISLTRVGGTARLTEPMEWTGLTDYQGETYTHRTTFDNWRERQQSYLFQVPIGLRFRYRKEQDQRAGLHAAFGFNLAVPVVSNYKNTSGSLTHTGWYEQWHLMVHDLPGRFETETVTTPQEESIAKKLHPVNVQAYAELGTTIRLNERAELLVAAYAQYMLNDFSAVNRDERTALGFANGRNNYTFMPEYRGLVGTDHVGAIHPWVAGVKLGVSIWPGVTERQKKRQLKRLIKQFPELTPVQQVHDTVIIHDTIILHDTVRITQVMTKEAMHTEAVKQADSLLSQAVIWFHFDQYDPIVEPEWILDSVAAMMNRYPDLKLHINGHACVIGTDAYNQKLALRRAQAVAAILRRKGIPSGRMKVRSYGATHPYRYNAEHQLSKDRRVEVVPEGYELLPTKQK
ncbi:MAG: OmpA family protein [Paludibacteraceae bacterium]|nr:OmpA family protein [Paludibacteraceae bacterium]